ncbi:MAG: phosphotransferase enzyme family protein [Dehalococcoidia bacterium]
MTFELQGPPDDAQEAPAGLIRAVLEGYGLRLVGEPVPVARSVLNPNFRAETDQGHRCVRLFRPDKPRDLAEAEHRLIAWAGDHGIPVCRPLAALTGETVVSVGDRLAAVFPWLEHRPLQRGEVTVAEAAVLGDLQGRIQALLVGYRDPVLEARGRSEVEWDTDQSIAALSRVDDVIRYYPAPSADRLEAQDALREQLDLLEGGAARPHTDFDGLPEQIDHCDFHDRNVLFGDGLDVLAVIDWERARVNPRAFHLLRALDFSGLTGSPPQVEAYATAYGRHVRLSRGECEAAVEQWWQSTLHNSWTFTEVFIRGNDAVRVFLPELGPRLRRLSDPVFRTRLAETLIAATRR